MAKYLFLIGLFILNSFGHAQTILKAELIITGEIVKSACTITPYQKAKNKSAYKYSNYANNRCELDSASQKPILQMNVTSRKIQLKQNNIAQANRDEGSISKRISNLQMTPMLQFILQSIDKRKPLTCNILTIKKMQDTFNFLK